MSELITTAAAQGRADLEEAVPAAVVDEHRVRAAAGLTMAAGGVAFAYAYFRQLYWPLQAVSSLFAVEFLVRVTGGLRRSPFGLIAGLLTRRHRPDWVLGPAEEIRLDARPGHGGCHGRHHQRRHPRLAAPNDLPDLPHLDVAGVRAGPVPGLRDPPPAGPARLGGQRSGPDRLRTRRLRHPAWLPAMSDSAQTGR